MQADDFNRKFNLEDDSQWSDDPESEELDEGYDEETDDEDDENFPGAFCSIYLLINISKNEFLQ